ncbi:hypothetical protein BS47DRAFT_48192 [Hydnum rufescens UP504]|uniref:Uncharacterized protein n=1 Tax=Hydnum rufescens UP504 TaxID=1448309 RepID=A0A9P6DTM5_9AGAM|nr:hypothetical protein BS47DRAFT_48192 [Hydnum rufescens UP504]
MHAFSATNASCSTSFQSLDFLALLIRSLFPQPCPTRRQKQCAPRIVDFLQVLPLLHPTPWIPSPRNATRCVAMLGCQSI